MNPLRWDWKDPDTAFEVFSGFAMFSGLFGPVLGSLHSFGKDLMKYGTFSYIAFASATGSTAVLAAYGNCALTNGEADPSKWNLKEIWVDMIFSVIADGGIQFASKFLKIAKSINFKSSRVPMSKSSSDIL